MNRTHDLMTSEGPSRPSARLLPASIRARLLLLLVVALAPILGLLGVIYTQRYQERRRQEYQANLEVARAVARAFEGFVDGVSRQELALGDALAALSPFNRERANRLLAASAALYPAVVEFRWASPQGRVRASSDPRAVGTDITRQTGFRPLRAGETVVGDLVRDRSSGRFRFSIRRGIAGPHGELAGIVSARIVPEQLGNAGLAIHRAGGGGVSLVDRTGRLVFRHAPPAPYAVGQAWGEQYPSLIPALRGRESLATVADATMGGRRRIAAWVPIPASGWVAGAGRPEESALAPIRRDLTRDIVLVVLVDALALLAALAVSRGITAPVRRLEEDAERLGAGDLAHRAGTGGPAEVDRLAAAFNSMAARLQEQSTALERRSEALRQSGRQARDDAARLQAILDAAPAIIWIAHDSQCRSITGNRAADAFSRVEEGRDLSKTGPDAPHLAHHRVLSDGVELSPEELPIQRVAASGEALLGCSVDFHFRDGTVRSLLGNVVPVLDADGCPDGAIAAFVDVTALKEAEAALRLHSEEVQRLNVRLQRAMAETHHRVKNNLQTIAALIDMQQMAGRQSVPATEMERLGRHVRGLASIHDLLTQEARTNGDAEFISVREAMAKLKPLLENMVGGRELRFHVEDVKLPVRQGTALAVLVNELVSNAAKHGEGAIDLLLAVADGRASLQVRDHGRGFPAGFTAASAANTGLELVQSVGSWDLQGDVEFGNAPGGGACVTVRFPVSL